MHHEFVNGEVRPEDSPTAASLLQTKHPLSYVRILSNVNRRAPCRFSKRAQELEFIYIKIYAIVICHSRRAVTTSNARERWTNSIEPHHGRFVGGDGPSVPPTPVHG